MTEVSFVIQFTRFDTPPQSVHLRPEIHVVYGESGVGKSALCRRLASPKIVSDRHNFRLSRISGYSSVMMVFQEPDAQIVSPTVGRELAFNMENSGWASSAIHERINEVVSMFDFPFEKDRSPATLSGGEREMLNLATALSASPDLLLIDDGMSFLSRGMKRRCVDLLRDWAERRDAVVLWFTSDADDLGASESRWLLSLESLRRIDEPLDKTYGSVKRIAGDMRIRLNGLSFRYPDSHPLFDEFSLEVGPFRSLAILGENGSGKSTLGALLSGVEEPFSGSLDVSLDGAPPVTVALPQSPERLFGGLTPGELAEMMMSENRAGKGYQQEVSESIATFQIVWERVRDIPFHELSLSEARLVLISMLCQANYDLLILDEPMFSLGMAQRWKLMESLEKTLRLKYLILITHDEKEADALCDVSLRIHEGELSVSSIKSYA